MLTLNHHPGTLTNAELVEIEILAAKFESKARDFTNWLKCYVEYEKARRHAAALAQYIEPEMPTINAAKWSDAELLDSLWVSFTVGRILREHPKATAFLDDVHACLLLWARQRLAPKD